MTTVFNRLLWITLICGAAVFSTPALAQNRAQKSVITQLLWQSLLQCYEIPEEYVSPDDMVVLRAELTTQGDIANLPDLVAPQSLSDGERALLRQATTALIMCTPFISADGDKAIYGEFEMVITNTGLSLANVNANVGSPSAVPSFDAIEVEGDAAEVLAADPIEVPAEVSTQPAVEPAVVVTEEPEREVEIVETLPLEAGDDVELPDITEGTAASEDLIELTRTERRELQRRLVLLGYNTRGVDGVFGPGSRKAVGEWQGDNGMPASGYFTQTQVTFLRAVSQSEYDTWNARPKRYTDRNGCLREANGKIIEGRSFTCDLNAAGQSLGLSR